MKSAYVPRRNVLLAEFDRGLVIWKTAALRDSVLVGGGEE